MQLLELFARCGVGEALVEGQALVHVAAVACREQRRNVQIYFSSDIDGPLQFRGAPRLQCAHCSIEHARIEREADFLDLARLLLAEDLAGAADLEVVQRKIKPGT